MGLTAHILRLKRGLPCYTRLTPLPHKPVPHSRKMEKCSEDCPGCRREASMTKLLSGGQCECTFATQILAYNGDAVAREIIQVLVRAWDYPCGSPWLTDVVQNLKIPEEVEARSETHAMTPLSSTTKPAKTASQIGEFSTQQTTLDPHHICKTLDTAIVALQSGQHAYEAQLTKLQNVIIAAQVPDNRVHKRSSAPCHGRDCDGSRCSRSGFRKHDASDGVSPIEQLNLALRCKNISQDVAEQVKKVNDVVGDGAKWDFMANSALVGLTSRLELDEEAVTRLLRTQVRKPSAPILEPSVLDAWGAPVADGDLAPVLSDHRQKTKHEGAGWATGDCDSESDEALGGGRALVPNGHHRGDAGWASAGDRRFGAWDLPANKPTIDGSDVSSRQINRAPINRDAWATTASDNNRDQGAGRGWPNSDDVEVNNELGSWGAPPVDNDSSTMNAGNVSPRQHKGAPRMTDAWGETWATINENDNQDQDAGCVVNGQTSRVVPSAGTPSFHASNISPRHQIKRVPTPHPIRDGAGWPTSILTTANKPATNHVWIRNHYNDDTNLADFAWSPSAAQSTSNDSSDGPWFAVNDAVAGEHDDGWGKHGGGWSPARAHAPPQESRDRGWNGAGDYSGWVTAGSPRRIERAPKSGNGWAGGDGWTTAGTPRKIERASEIGNRWGGGCGRQGGNGWANGGGWGDADADHGGGQKDEPGWGRARRRSGQGQGWNNVDSWGARVDEWSSVGDDGNGTAWMTANPTYTAKRAAQTGGGWGAGWGA